MVHKQDPDDPFKLGMIVRIRNSRERPGMVIEYRGRLGPNRSRIYRVAYLGDDGQVGDPDVNGYTEVREDQLELVPTSN